MTDTLTTEEIEAARRLLPLGRTPHHDTIDRLCDAALKGVEPEQDGWERIETAPFNTWIEAGMPSKDSPTGWWVCTAKLQAPEDEVGHWTDGGQIMHYNGTTLVSGFRGPFTHWRRLTPPSKQEVAGASEGDEDPQKEWNQLMSARVTPNTDREELPSDWLAKEVDTIGPETDKWPDGIKQSFEDATQPTPQQEAEPDWRGKAGLSHLTLEETDRLFPTPPKGEEKTISAQDPSVVLAGIKQFGLAPDGCDLRDLRSAIESLREENARLGTLLDEEQCASNASAYRCDTLKAQVEKLREALQTIRDSFWTDGESGQERVEDLKAIAERALSQTEGA